MLDPIYVCNFVLDVGGSVRKKPYTTDLLGHDRFSQEAVNDLECTVIKGMGQWDSLSVSK